MSIDVFYSAPCLTEQLPALNAKQLLVKFKGIDRRFISQSLHKFIKFNEETFRFLDIEPQILGIDPIVELSFQTGKYIGAIPLRSSINGKQIGDFLVFPRFGDRKALFSQLTKIIMMLGENIEPEFMNTLPLISGNVVRPPIYHDAVNYINAYEKGFRKNWNLFRVEQKIHPFPKPSTDWAKYAESEFAPEKRLRYPARDSVLSPNHREWQQLKYVFKLAKGILTEDSTPLSIRLKMKPIFDTLDVKTQSINVLKANNFVTHASDPYVIKELKHSANTLLHRSGHEMGAWRIDISILFERYVQFIIQKVVREMPARYISNPRFSSHGFLPNWGIKYLEPDALIENDHTGIAIDAKYKAHFYSRNQTSDLLKSTHREDLHQILAYCSFSKNQNKMGMLFYPSNSFSSQTFSYTNSYNKTRNEISLIGLPFEPDISQDTILSLWEIFSNKLASPLQAMS